MFRTGNFHLHQQPRCFVVVKNSWLGGSKGLAQAISCAKTTNKPACLPRWQPTSTDASSSPRPCVGKVAGQPTVRPCCRNKSTTRRRRGCKASFFFFFFFGRLWSQVSGRPKLLPLLPREFTQPRLVSLLPSPNYWRVQSSPDTHICTPISKPSTRPCFALTEVAMWPASGQWFDAPLGARSLQAIGASGSGAKQPEMVLLPLLGLHHGRT